MDPAGDAKENGMGESDFTYGYVPASGNLLATVAGPAHTVTKAWEADRNVLTSITSGPVSGPITRFSYEVNALGQRTEVDRTGSAFPAGSVVTWGYDSFGQVTSHDHSDDAKDEGFSYDSIGNRRSWSQGSGAPVTYAANKLNQYGSISGSITPGFDADGNMTSGELPAEPGAERTLQWDANNRLRTVRDGDELLQINFYDYVGRRFCRHDRNGSGFDSAFFIYDGWNVIAEITGGNGTVLSKTHHWGTDLSGSMQRAGGVGGLLATTHHEGSTSDTYYPCYDGNGNIAAYLDESSDVAAHFEYSAFGQVVASGGAKADEFAYRFSTKPEDKTTGLLYYGFRYYDPVTGRWPSRDPIEEEGGLNIYGFLSNAGLVDIDYLGLSQCDKKEHVGNVWIDELKYESGPSPFNFPDRSNPLEQPPIKRIKPPAAGAAAEEALLRLNSTQFAAFTHWTLKWKCCICSAGSYGWSKQAKQTGEVGPRLTTKQSKSEVVLQLLEFLEGGLCD